MPDGLEAQVQMLDRDMAALKSQVDTLMQKLSEVTRQGNENHTDISSLATKIDGLREDLKGFKDLPNSFVSRDMLNAKLESYENQLKNLKDNFHTLDGKVGAVQAQLTTAQLNISKDIQTNTQWTIGVLITLVFAAFALFGNAAKFLSH